MSDSDSEASSQLCVTTQIVNKWKDASCQECGFNKWQPGDTCYIFEHRCFREHVCPACMVIKRKLSLSYYRRNKNAPANEEEKVKRSATKNDEREALKKEATQVANLWIKKDFKAVQQLLDEKFMAGCEGGETKKRIRKGK